MARTRTETSLATSGTVTVSYTGQDVIYLELLRLAANPEPTTLPVHRLRIKIRSNAYRDQGYARIERWNGDAWQELYTLDGGTMQTEPGLYVKRNKSERAPTLATETIWHVAAGTFKADRDTLVARAAEILL